MGQVQDQLPVIAACVIDGPAGILIATGRATGIAALLKNGPGDYTITLGGNARLSAGNINESFSFGILSPTTVVRVPSADKLSATQVRVRVRNAANAFADAILSMTIRHIPG